MVELSNAKASAEKDAKEGENDSETHRGDEELETVEMTDDSWNSV